MSKSKNRKMVNLDQVTWSKIKEQGEIENKNIIDMLRHIVYTYLDKKK